jgi:hypothetical protein
MAGGLYARGGEIHKQMGRKKEGKKKKGRKKGLLKNRTNSPQGQIRPPEILIRPIAQINRGALLLHRTDRYE